MLATLRPPITTSPAVWPRPQLRPTPRPQRSFGPGCSTSTLEDNQKRKHIDDMSILKDIEKLAKPVFQLPDLEDEDFDGISTKTISKTKIAHFNDDPNMRRMVISRDIENNSKYGGAKVSRGDIFDDISGMVGLANHITDERDKTEAINVDNEGDDFYSYEEEANDVVGQSCTEGDDFDEEEEDDKSRDDSAVAILAESDRNEVAESGEDLTKPSSSGRAEAVVAHNLMKNLDADKQKQKGESIRTQTEIWEHLLYMKIKLHAALTAFNQLPRGQLAKVFVKEADEDTVKNLKLAQKNGLRLVSSLLEAESILLASSSFTTALVGEKGEIVDSDDEEIESSEDEKDVKDSVGDISGDSEDIDGVVTLQSRPANLKSLSKRLCESEERFSKFRDATLLKWDERTKLISSRRTKNFNNDFSAFEKENIVSQIEKVCADKPRLLKRIRTKKSDVERIGGNLESEEDDEIYDDDDFYQVLLKEFIDKKTNTTQDPVTMTRHYIELQKLKSKRMKKKKYADHRASKDRRIKYLPIPKLINYYPAMPEMVPWSHESRNELFKSLFS